MPYQTQITAYHVTPDPTGWRVLRVGGNGASRVFEEKEKAVAEAMRLAKHERPSEIHVYGRDGEIEQTRVLSNGPYIRSAPRRRDSAVPPQKHFREKL